MNDSTRLGELEQLVMLAVLRCGDDAYGARIARQLQQRGGRSVTIATIYVTLTRLEAKGLVRSRFTEPTAERGGKAKRVFAVEPEGLAALRNARDTLARMWDGLDGAVDAARPAHAR